MNPKVKQRREQILDLLSKVPISSTPELAAKTNVTTETMRKDLDFLVEDGKIVKVHGGVALANPVSEFHFDQRIKKNADLKLKIAKTAATLIKEGESLLLEGCTTCLELAKVLATKEELLKTLVIFTNSLEIATLLSQDPKCQKLFLLGGWINLEQYASQGYLTTKIMQNIHVNKAFISGAAINQNLVVTAYNDDDMAFQQAALQCAEETFLLMDSSKFGTTAVLTVAPLSQMKYLVTDKKLSSESAKEIASLNVTYHHAN